MSIQRGERMAPVAHDPSKTSWFQRVRAFWRQHLKPVWDQYQWVALGALWLSAVALGYFGAMEEFAARKAAALKNNKEFADRTYLDYLYRSFQLFFLDD